MKKSYMTDTEVWLALQEYGEVGYTKLPSWLRSELTARRMQFDSTQRIPVTDKEKQETESDAKEHRMYNNEMNVNDYKDKYHV